ncbi:hypothetical protein GCM10010433_69820 [Streptomyces pulveraceus]
MSSQYTLGTHRAHMGLRAEVGSRARCPAKDEPARRGYEKLVDRWEGLMRAPLKPRDRGCRG